MSQNDPYYQNTMLITSKEAVYINMIECDIHDYFSYYKSLKLI